LLAQAERLEVAAMPADDGELVYVSGDCEIDLARRELRTRGSAASLGSRGFEVGEMLVRSAGQLVTKDELMEQVWPGTRVEENTLQAHISAVRKALGPFAGLLRTESGRGYRLLGDWTTRQASVAPAPLIRTPANQPFAWQPPEPVRSNLPLSTSGLIGRSAAVARLRDLLSAYRSVTLTGPGGIGKTALALEVGRDLLASFDDGVCFVELAPLSDPTLERYPS
jgi:DNA-binding winged helix-turn-helix (wHTH) protein